jgi:hypothetical protein
MSRESALGVAQAAIAQIPAPLPVETSTQAPAPTTPPVTNTEIPQPDAARFAAIARKEAELVKRQQDFKREMEAHNAEKEKVRTVLTKAQEFEALRAKDPVAALKGLGFSETEIFNFMAAQPERKDPTPEERAAQIAREEAEKLIKARDEAAAKTAKEAAEARDKALISDLKTETGKYIETNAEALPYCAYFGPIAIEQAYENIKANLDPKIGDGTLLTVKEALELAEQHYKEQDEDMSTKVRKPKPTEAAPEQAAGPTRTRTVTQGDPSYKPTETITRNRTISNNTGVTSAASIPRKETHDQKKARLAEMIRTNGIRK